VKNHPYPERDADLRGGEANAWGLAHDVDHPVDDALDLIGPHVPRRHLLRGLVQDGVAGLHGPRRHRHRRGRAAALAAQQPGQPAPAGVRPHASPPPAADGTSGDCGTSERRGGGEEEGGGGEWTEERNHLLSCCSYQLRLGWRSETGVSGSWVELVTVTWQVGWAFEYTGVEAQLYSVDGPTILLPVSTPMELEASAATARDPPQSIHLYLGHLQVDPMHIRPT
jgi:hypothetical protein